ncbi:MAG: glucokinase [Burkholderiales bacterium]|jgi:glucokinase|nr:glucokinase [Burkholderiales bacterium]
MVHFPRLISDIGGTNARFSLEVKPYEYESTKIFACKDFKTLSDAVNEYLQLVGVKGSVKYAALALPTPVIDDSIFMVNSPWQTFSQSQTRAETGFEKLIFLNDWHAMALSIPHIPEKNLVRIGGTANPDISKPKLVIGPGTGLGMASLIRHPLGEHLAIASECGRSSFPPVNEEETELWSFVHKRFSHVSAERFLSGPGLQLIYEGLCHINDKIITVLPNPSEITQKGISGEDWLCQRSVDIFCRMLGTVASNVAVAINSFGGVYIGGGIIPKILDYFIKSEFRSRFEDKGRYRPFLVKMPVYVITHEFPAFLGASHALDSYLSKGYIP